MIDQTMLDIAAALRQRGTPEHEIRRLCALIDDAPHSVDFGDLEGDMGDVLVLATIANSLFDDFAHCAFKVMPNREVATNAGAGLLYVTDEQIGAIQYAIGEVKYRTDLLRQSYYRLLDMSLAEKQRRPASSRFAPNGANGEATSTSANADIGKGADRDGTSSKVPNGTVDPRDLRSFDREFRAA